MTDLIERYRVINAEWEKACSKCGPDGNDYSHMTDAQFEKFMELMDKADDAYELVMDKHHPGWRKLPYHERPSIDGAPKSSLDVHVGGKA